MAARKRIKKRTFSEFMAWLEGVEAMQGNEWAPDAKQWKAIRDMLDHVIPDEVEVQVEVPTQPAPAGQWIVPAEQIQPYAQPAPQQPEMQVPQGSTLDGQAAPQRRPTPSGFNEAPPKVRTTKKEEMIDTSSGHYDSEYL